MKNLFKILIPFILFLSGCSDNHNVIVNTQDGTELNWIGCNNCPSTEDVWFLGLTVPIEPDEIEDQDWDNEYPCDKIELFQSEGYFNYILSSTPGQVRTKVLSDYYWVWEEE